MHLLIFCFRLYRTTTNVEEKEIQFENDSSDDEPKPEKVAGVIFERYSHGNS